jgi:hypothetical protein
VPTPFGRIEMARVKRRSTSTARLVSGPAEYRHPANSLVMDIRDVAEAMGVTTQCIRNWRKKGKIPPPLPCSGSKWSRSTIEAYLRGEWPPAGRAEPPAKAKAPAGKRK